MPSPNVPPQISKQMFHTISFPPSRPTEAHDTPKSATGGNPARRITTPHACAECKRRKIRCDGKQPCGQCMGCRSPKACHYDKHRQRVIPSRKTLLALQNSLDECKAVLRRLYPSRDVQSLLPLPRETLIALLDSAPSQSVRSQASSTISQTSPLSQEFQSPLASTSDDDPASLANLEQVPSRDTEWDEERRDRDPIPAESDDVNALSLSVDRQSSYLGASSIKAALLVMLKVAPALRSFLVPPPNTSRHLSQTTPAPMTKLTRAVNSPHVQWSSEGQTLIDAYFNRVHMTIPMLDEPSFRATYLKGQRNDGPWLALLNMVFAMGSIAATKSDNRNHIMFYNRAKEHMDLDSFGSGHLEALQALGIMGGYYLHYINKPNMANAMMGAALRMACALGLHRESLLSTKGNRIDLSEIPADIRRRTYWSLFCLDTWASTTLGRPSLGRWGPAITIRPPEGSNDANFDPNSAQKAGILPLIENIKFGKISTQIQDVLALSPLPRSEIRESLDTQLVEWYEATPWILRSNEPRAESLSSASNIMKWRYQNQRIVLHRPVLLNLANRGVHGTATHEDNCAVQKCRDIAAQTISDIAHEWTQNQFAGWNAVWFLYQAVMIPLVSIFWEPNSQAAAEWNMQIETVISLFAAMTDWSLAARRSREVVSTMYEASKRPVTRVGSPRPDGLQAIEGVDEDVLDVPNLEHGQNIWDFDGMLWGHLPDGFDMPFDGCTPQYEDGGGFDGDPWA